MNTKLWKVMDGEAVEINLAWKICLVPDVSSKITDVVKIGMEEKNPNLQHI